MKQVRNMSQIELAAYVQSHLSADGIQVVLSGGASVAYHSRNKYVSHDVDLINVAFAKRSKISQSLQEIGFAEKGRHFVHPDTPYIVEFPDGPLSVGEEPVKEIKEIELSTGVLRVISATDCVKDRLCAFYFWKDQQGLQQAVLVAQNNKVDLREIQRWSKVEGKVKEFETFKAALAK